MMRRRERSGGGAQRRCRALKPRRSDSALCRGSVDAAAAGVPPRAAPRQSHAPRASCCRRYFTIHRLSPLFADALRRFSFTAHSPCYRRRHVTPFTSSLC
jgi:transposase